ncbi:hypothetical protein BDY19DRAFT_938336 [Irpex rosettiformis]|uniref:Uncharacterized protein n=1 Tax=Irpex rosettiformis TaxID=378272 RepID=A0ACB8U7J8_9APHY|nr:hypothetical protein BDY19DRAFT_938336 [Irpex rosettiformis]
MYPTTPGVQKAFSRNMNDTNAEEQENAARVAWAWITMGVQVRSRGRYCAFSFRENTHNLLRDATKPAKIALASLEKCAAELMARQHRTFVFILYFCRDMVRVTRWDRNGCIVSTPIDLSKTPEVFLNLVYSLATMSDEELGYDITATLASEEELEALAKIRPKNPYALERAQEILDNQALYPIYKVACVDIRGGGTTEYFVGKHTTASRSVTHRCTKGYIAFIISASRLCFLKDYWCTKLNQNRTELSIYEVLYEKGVKYVATALGGGFVGAQQTATQDYLPGEEVPTELFHYRLAIEELARPLESYRHSKELIRWLFDGLQGHEEAWTKAGILHRDISAGNILSVVDQDDETDENRRGILNDWDVCKYKSEMNDAPLECGRPGTSIFMSALSVKFPRKPNELADDLEAFIHVLTYLSLQFHFHEDTVIGMEYYKSMPKDALTAINRKNASLASHISSFYYHPTQEGFHVGGLGKYSDGLLGEPPVCFLQDHVSPMLVKIVDELYALLKRHYSSIDKDILFKLGYDINRMYTRRSVRPKFRDAKKDQAAGTQEHQVTSRQPNVLDTHEAIMNIFSNALADDYIEGLEEVLLDKTEDQFLGLPWETRYSPYPTQSGRSTNAGAVDGSEISKLTLEASPEKEQEVQGDESEAQSSDTTDALKQVANVEGLKRKCTSEEHDEPAAKKHHSEQTTQAAQIQADEGEDSRKQ